MKNVLILLTFLLIQLTATAQIPVASFTSKTRVCSGVQFNLHNTSTNADTYEWLVYNYHYSYNQDTVLSLSVFCSDYAEVKLIAKNTSSGLSDTISKIVYASATSCGMHLYVDYQGCIGDTVTYAGNSDAAHYQWTFDTPQPIVGGCDTCSFISFVLVTPHPTAVNTQTYEGGCSDITEYTAYFCPNNVGVNEVNQSNEVSIAPNPMTDKSIVRINNTTGKKYQLSLYNIEGRLMSKTENITSNEIIIIERKNMAAGVYFYLLTGEDGKSMRGKLIME
jgi:hypothetical protein